MAKKRPSVQKREREMLKRQREMRKAAKAAAKRERRFAREGEDALSEDGAPDDRSASEEASPPRMADG